MGTVVWLAGAFIDPVDAKVSLFDSGYLLGDGLFATMRGYDGRCFRVRTHIDELVRGAALLGFSLPESPERIASLANEAARRSGEPDAYVRVTITRGPPDAKTATMSIIARAMDVPAEEAYERGVDAITVSPRRIPPGCFDTSLKPTSYIVQVLARREVAVRGAAEGIQLSVDGALASGTMASLFLVRKNQLLTPSLASGCRAGITRAAVLELAPAVGLEPLEERLEPSMLTEVDEAFFASTRVECLPIARIDDAPIGSGTFAKTHALRRAFHDLCKVRPTGGVEV